MAFVNLRLKFIDYYISPNQMEQQPDILHTKSFEFALKVIEHGKYLQTEQREFILARQFIRSGTSIGANIREAFYAQSKLDFIHKLSISLKEANESKYWIELLYQSKYFDQIKYDSLFYSNQELIRLLTASLKTTKRNLK